MLKEQAVQAQKVDPRFEYAWGLVGDCSVYGLFIYGDNGVDLFVPCGTGCVGFPPICPDDGKGMVRQFQNNTEQQIKLKY